MNIMNNKIINLTDPKHLTGSNSSDGCVVNNTVNQLLTVAV